MLSPGLPGHVLGSERQRERQRGSDCHPSTVDEASSRRETTLINNRIIPGAAVYQIVHDVIHVTLNRSDLRAFFETKGDFAIDEVGDKLSPSEHFLFAQYYALLFQSSEFPAAGFVPRRQQVYVRRGPGMRCQNEHLGVCNDNDWGAPERLKLTPIDLEGSTNGTGWHNKVALMSFVTMAHLGMRSLFATGNWHSAFTTSGGISEYMRTVDGTNESSVLNYTGESIESWRNKPGVAPTMEDHLAQNRTIFESCFGSEVILARFYAVVFAVRVIEDALNQRKLYGFGDHSELGVSHAYDDVHDEIFRHNITITSSAGHQAFEDTPRTFLGSMMTRSTVSRWHVKRDRPMSGAMLMGNSLRHLDYITYYPNSYYGYESSFVDADSNVVVVDWRQLGAYYAAFNGFKFDFTHNTMTVLRLSERPRSERTGYDYDWFEQERNISRWYRAHELHDPESLIKLSEAIWTDDSPTDHDGAVASFCMEALHRKLAQVAWLLLLRLKPVMSHLVFMSMINPDPPATWFKKQMLVNEVVGEILSGNRVAFPFVREQGNASLGAAWVLVPLLNTLRELLGPAVVLETLMTEMNASFLDLVEVEAGKLMLHDASLCAFGFSTLGVDSSDTKATIWPKLYLRMENMVSAIVDRVAVIQMQLTRQVAAPTQIPPAYVSYSHPSSSIFHLQSQGLRVMRFSMWSLGVVLNLFGAVVALRYVWRLWCLWRDHQFSDLDVALSACLDLQGMCVISSEAILIMSFSCIPLIFSYHLPQDDTFMPDLPISTRSDFFLNEFIVLLSLSWFVRLGNELGIYMIHLRHYNWWFRLLIGRVRLAVLAIVALIRWTFPTNNLDYDMGLLKLLVSCLSSFLFGFMTVWMSILSDKEKRRTEDVLGPLMQRQNLARNVHGVASQWNHYWSHAGMIIEGWRLLRVDGKPNVLIKGVAQHIELPSAQHQLSIEVLTLQQFYDFQIQSRIASRQKSSSKLSATISMPTTRSFWPWMTRKVAHEFTVVAPKHVPLHGTHNRPSGWRHVVITAILGLQALWAMAIPVKNVLAMPWKQVEGNTKIVSSSRYDTTNVTSTSYTGIEVYRIVRDVVNLSLNRSEVRAHFERKGDFELDDISSLLTPREHHRFAQYYALLFQASELPAGGFVARQQQVQLRATSSWVQVALTCKEDVTLSGVRCANAQGLPCGVIELNDSSSLTLERIDVSAATAHTGWHNKISLMAFVTHVHAAMRVLFTKRDWASAFTAIAPSVGSTTRVSSTFNYSGTGALPGAAAASDLVKVLDRGIRHIETCVGTEYVLANYYANIFAARIIQEAVAANGLYEPKPAVDSSSDLTDIWNQMFGNNVVITTGAGSQGFSDEVKTLAGQLITRNTRSVWNMKRDREMTGLMPMGNAAGILLAVVQQPSPLINRWSFRNDSASVVTEWSLSGDRLAELSGFKTGAMQNTMGAFRLSELASFTETSRSVVGDWFEQEQTIASWYRNHEVNASNSLIKLAERIWGLDSPTLREDPQHRHCLEGMFRKFAQTLWIMALKKHPVMNHLVFMSMSEPDPPHVWFYNQMMVTEVVGENIGGFRVVFPFARDGEPPHSGEAWPLIPLVHALSQAYGKDVLLTLVMESMADVFLDLIEVEEGALMFKDATHCFTGFATLNVTRNDAKQSLWIKLRDKMEATLNMTIQQVPAIHEQMQRELSLAEIPREYLTDNALAAFTGPPVYWKPTALSIGLLRLSAKLSPTNAELLALKKVLVCYKTLETRFFNTSVRCWAEPGSSQETRQVLESDGLRMLESCSWALGVALNLMGAMVSLGFVYRLIRLWAKQRFAGMSMGMAINVSIQGLGVLTIDGIIIMTFSSLALMLSYHMPQDEVFMKAGGQHSGAFAELMVMLCLTWLFRLGTEMVTPFIHLRHFSWWFSIVASRLRLVALLLVVLMREFWTVQSYDQGLVKLIASCLVTLIVGIGMTLIAALKDTDNVESQDQLSQLMMHHGFSRNRYGVLGQLQSGWSHAGMVLEGWHVLSIDNNAEALVVGQAVILPGFDSPHTFACKMITPSLLAQLEGVAVETAHNRTTTSVPSTTDVLSGNVFESNGGQ
ncbi:TPA: hypothetical protein N0F65_011365 [Lagenidium giganteum]|uniref:1,3-beta-glucan synthase n=1 Tax=Lagenidium giganteum TaxID=4803 RepID=A0AAV2Z7T6_9STRA|nr:TPA: hypothetical protein N0F65_011365 [Lagenidium giganteum]